jgi:lipoprotein-anchoring transpeptidase ErfK/SrfK
MNTPAMPLWLAAAALVAAPVVAQEVPASQERPASQAVQLASAAPAAPAPKASTREIVLQLSRRTISLRENGKLISSWPVAIGDPSTPTPVGRFSVQNKVVNPKYQSSKSGKINATVGPNGPLGDRWLGFQQSGPNQYGIHGTPAAWSWTVTSRAAVTNGCVRMLHDHVRQLFDLVEVGTPVIVQR